ncbi:MAG: hypothetical protein EOO50_02335 [Flavobacterium sp.]|uniref:hypothetical protein n=1 Tax=Flavobacterium sp. TaxID=239 RepID=UPI001220B36F|nr:hypothetical protein [Flavobacterium sp.]RZJ68278.1 MAG: hypothetical protein EOO50_02335 [Flavobacterium sp.]
MKNLKNMLSLFLLVVCQSVFSQTERPVTDLAFDNSTNCRIRYYYYPNLEAYFDKQKSVYIFRDKGEWTSAPEIPSGYRGYGLYNKVNTPIEDYDDEDVTQFFASHKKKYPYNSLKKSRTATASVN